LPGEIVEAQTYAVDAFSGATITSNAIMTAVKDCIDQAAVKQPVDDE
jgi:fumarate reductase flavoprotein subunit